MVKKNNIYKYKQIMSKNSSISKIVKEIEVKKLKELYQEFNDVITLISNFIIKKKLMKG